jgi:tetratricopeptide (TPR) repeat protein
MLRNCLSGTPASRPTGNAYFVPRQVGNAYFLQGNYAQAIADFREMLKLSKDPELQRGVKYVLKALKTK